MDDQTIEQEIQTKGANVAQHSAERGRADARAQAVEQIWPLMGYELRSHIHAMKGPRTG